MLREGPHVGKRHAVVDPQHEVRIRDHVRRHRRPVGAQQVEHLRQVQLPLGVVRTQARQRPQQGVPREREDTCVDLADLELLRGGIPRLLGLHHARHRAPLVAHHAPVTTRVLQHRRDHRRRRARERVRLHQLRDRRGAHQRHIPAQYHYHRPRVNRIGRREDRPAGAVGARLHHQLDPLRQHLSQGPRR